MSPRIMHLGLNCTEYGRHSGGWLHPDSDVSRMPNIDTYLKVAQWAEKGKFDQLFIADSPVHNWGRYSVGPTRLDPLALALLMAEATERIGIVATISTSYNDPYDIARRAASTDRLIRGRLGINYVASSGDEIARNYNLPGQLPHDQRYARSQEFLEVVTKLWACAATADRAALPVRHAGRHFQVDAPLDVLQPPLGRPLIVQAGSSVEGRDLAARWADAIYAGGSSLERAQEFYADIKARTAAYGRDPDSIKVMLGITPFIGQTVAEAQELERTLNTLHARGADTIGHLSALLEWDLKAYDPDGPLPFDDLPAVVSSASVSQSTLFKRMAREEGLSIRETAFRCYAGGLSNMQLRFAFTPPELADMMQAWFEAGTCDGFTLVAPILPRTIEDFVRYVIPILRERGLVRAEYSGTTHADHLDLGELDARVAA